MIHAFSYIEDQENEITDVEEWDIDIEEDAFDHNLLPEDYAMAVNYSFKMAGE